MGLTNNTHVMFDEKDFMEWLSKNNHKNFSSKVVFDDDGIAESIGSVVKKYFAEKIVIDALKSQIKT